MIRNVVMVRLRPDHDRARLGELQQAFRRLDCPGTLSYVVADDAGLREGNWDFVIVADFPDVDAYRHYDADPEHNRLRGELAPITEEIARIQVELPDGAG